MPYALELIINKSEVTEEDFRTLYTTVSSYLGSLKKVRFHISLKDNRIRYFIESENDLSALSSGLHFGVLRPVEESEVSLPEHTSKERFVNFVTGGTLLDLQEKMSVKRSKTLEHFVCDVRRINFEYAKVSTRMYFKNATGQYSVASKSMSKFPAHLFAFDFKTANTFMKSESPKYLQIEKVLHTIVPENINALLEVDTYPYFPKPYYLPLPAYEFDKHSMIVGASGSGKSKFIELFIDRLNRLPSRYNYRAIVIDPHANLADDLRGIEGAKIVDFNNESTELFAGAEADITAATELTTTLMKSLLGDSFNPRVERVLRFSLFILFSSQSMSLGMLKRFLTELELRQQILDHVQGHVPQNITHFFATDFNEIRTAYYNDGLLPIISLVEELELQPSLLGEGGISLQQTINSNFLTVFSLNKVSMGEKVVKTVAGLLIQQIFLLAQSRAFNEKVILFIDEVSVVQNPALSSILSEARKFNLFVVLTQQYLQQVDKELRDSIFANVSNYYCFRVAEEDAIQLAGNLPMELPNELLLEAKENGIREETLKVRMLTDLHPRECIVRMAAGGLLLPCFKARTLDIEHNIVHTTLSQNYTPIEYADQTPTLTKFEENTEPKVYDELPPAPQPTKDDTNNEDTAEQPPKTFPAEIPLPEIQLVNIEELPELQPISRIHAAPQPLTESFIQLRPEQLPPDPPPSVSAPPGGMNIDAIINQESTKEENGKGEQK
jgi:DNA helicase HerA-like ATPase